MRAITLWCLLCFPCHFNKLRMLINMSHGVIARYRSTSSQCWLYALCNQFSNASYDTGRVILNSLRSAILRTFQLSLAANHCKVGVVTFWQCIEYFTLTRNARADKKRKGLECLLAMSEFKFVNLLMSHVTSATRHRLQGRSDAYKRKVSCCSLQRVKVSRVHGYSSAITSIPQVLQKGVALTVEKSAYPSARLACVGGFISNQVIEFAQGIARAREPVTALIQTRLNTNVKNLIQSLSKCLREIIIFDAQPNCLFAPSIAVQHTSQICFRNAHNTTFLPYSNCSYCSTIQEKLT